MRDLQRSIWATLTYHDLFEYPLTVEEIFRFLISPTPVGKPIIAEAVRQMVKKGQISSSKNFYFLNGRRKIVKVRREKENWSRGKIAIARRLAHWLRLIPWVKMVAVSGSLAMKNAAKEDDIDLLLVASRRRLWLTRALVTLMTELVTERRRAGDKKIRDKICLNMFLDENCLYLPKDEQDLYSAHEVCQLLPILDKDNTHKRFFRTNYWVKKYLANCLPDIKMREYKDIKREERVLDFLENLAFRSQLWYMRSRRTTEIVEPKRIRFHPQDCRERILKRYENKIKKLGLARGNIPLDKNLKRLLK